MMRDRRSLDTLYDQANAWEKVIELCRELGARSQVSGIDLVLVFIRELKADADRYERLMNLIDRISCGDMDKLIVQEGE